VTETREEVVSVKVDLPIGTMLTTPGFIESLGGKPTQR
jgi:hypothetical protein